MIVPVILSGGSGTRLWPLSREAYPKQFLSLVGNGTLFQETLARAAEVEGCSHPLVICNEEHRFLVAEQLRARGYDHSGILLEPVGRNTAPAVACAALKLADEHPDALLLVMPSDHVITNPAVFAKAVTQGSVSAREGYLVTFGIVPEQPETGYGYIRRGEHALTDGVYPVQQFVEKPDRATAQGYLDSGDYLWNSGMFLLRADSYLEELEHHRPDILKACRNAIQEVTADLDFLRLDKAAFSACPSESIDYAVMEPTERAAVVPLDAGWNDVGAWSSLWEVAERDDNGNVQIGDVISEDTRNCYLRGEHRLVAGVGIEDLVVIETADAVLVSHRNRVQDVKAVVTKLKRSDREEHLHHVRCYRPWGSYETVDECQRFKVKRIIVKPGERLSLQKHHHRAEHWVVVKGTARVTCGDEEKVLSEDQSVYIPLGTTHRLENPGRIPLELIEVQTGSYLGEDDIVRFEDIYGRHE